MEPTDAEIERALRDIRRRELPFDRDSEAIEVADALVRFNPDVDTPFPSNNPNRVRFGGCERPLTPDLLDRIITAYRQRGIPHFFIWAGPTIDDAPVDAWLIERGGRPFLLVGYPVLVRASDANAHNDSTLIARTVGVEELRSFEALILRIQPEEQHARRFMSHFKASPPSTGASHADAGMSDGAFLPVLAFDGGTPVGTSMLMICGEWAYLGWAAVRPEFRGRGGQRAMIAERLRLAARHGCRWCVSETVDFITHSLDNLRALGFVERYQPRVFEFGCAAGA
jgi:GNAT superfamily N-acetyltransferase